MDHLQTFQVFPRIPKPLSFLEVLSRNIWWCWHHDAVELFRRIDPRLWDKAGRNPIVFSTFIPQHRLEELAQDTSFLAHMDRVKKLFRERVCTPSHHERWPLERNNTIAYFSMEFGIHESIPLFAGGLGILAGDHLKAASDIGLPLTGVGLLYRQGYFRQYLDSEGWQQEDYTETDFYQIPMVRAKNKSGKFVRIGVDGPDGHILADVWRIKVGNVTLYLLDTNIPENSREIRNITARLYSGEYGTRLAQEVLLGIGGVRALRALDLNPVICHMNEGHCSFANVERVAHLMEARAIDLETAQEIAARTTIFTTHTPVAAGHDEFPADQVRPYLLPFEGRFGISVDKILSWGQMDGADSHSPVSMFVLGVRLARYCNGVSRLHGSVARKMWAGVWPGLPEEEIPISHVTNGVHIPSWLSYENALLCERYIGPNWRLTPSAPEVLTRIDEMYDEELWRAHEMSRSRLIRTCRRLMVQQYGRRNAPKAVMREAEAVLDQDILTIGFARRFATYKRAFLLFMDLKRLEAIINNPSRPVQFIFAGKAHPKDNEGKGLIQQVVAFAQNSHIRHRFIFIEDYDIHLARHLVHGADVWLNTPRRPFEACGTSGMKAAINGVLNLSILDGWWDEGYNPDRGWAIGSGEAYEDNAYQDTIESQALYNILENDVIPAFYDRQHGGLPSRWIKMMKESMKLGMRDFCAYRMVSDYENSFYLPAAKRYMGLVAESAKEARALAAQRERLQRLWKHVRVCGYTRSGNGPFRVGDAINVTSEIHLGALTPDEVNVELYYGKMRSIETLHSGNAEPMQVKEELGNGDFRYESSINCHLSGRFGFTVRVMPKGDDWTRFTPKLITWA